MNNLERVLEKIVAQQADVLWDYQQNLEDLIEQARDEGYERGYDEGCKACAQ